MANQQQVQDAVSFFEKQYPEEYFWLLENKEGNEFANSLWSQLTTTGHLSERQIIYARPRRAKAPTTPVNIVQCRAMLEAFLKAQESGLKRPRLHIGDMVFSLAPSHGKNAGCIYIKMNGVYMGKITPDGDFYSSQDASEGEIEEIVATCEKPFEGAVMHGKDTGQCACCGRELTNPESIERGIGPVCAGKWGW